MNNNINIKYIRNYIKNKETKNSNYKISMVKLNQRTTETNHIWLTSIELKKQKHEINSIMKTLTKRAVIVIFLLVNLDARRGNTSVSS